MADYHKAADYKHTVYRLTEGAEPEEIGHFYVNGLNYGISTPVTLVAEGMLNDHLAASRATPGQYRVVVTGYEGKHEVVRVDRPYPLPEKWRKLSMWDAERTGRPSKFFADNVLKMYPGTTVEVVGEHLEVFGEHYHGAISTAELAERTGYQLPPDTPRPTRRGAEITEVNR